MRATKVTKNVHGSVIVEVAHERLGVKWVARYHGEPTGFKGIWRWQRWPKMGSVGETMQRFLDGAVIDE